MKKNIVLIGMPDSGKTIIGKIVSEKLGLKFLNTESDGRMDMHEPLNTENDCSVAIEREVVYLLSNGYNSVISTGAEIIKNHLHKKEIKENTVVIFIDKFSEMVAKEEEALKNKIIKDEDHKNRENYKIHKKCCDLHLINNNSNSVDEIVEYICHLWGYTAEF